MGKFDWLEKELNEFQSVKVDNFNDVVITDSEMSESVAIPIDDIPKLIGILQGYLD